MTSPPYEMESGTLKWEHLQINSLQCKRLNKQMLIQRTIPLHNPIIKCVASIIDKPIHKMCPL